MYKTTVRALVRHGIGRLNDGDPSFLLRLAAPSAEIAFPGDNTWAAMFRPVRKGRECHVTHRGIEECRRFAEQFTSAGIQFSIEDVLVNGPPWNTRVVVRAHDFVPAEQPGGEDAYNNRVVAFLDLRWGRLHRWEDYEDTQRTAAWDKRRAADPAGQRAS